MSSHELVAASDDVEHVEPGATNQTARNFLLSPGASSVSDLRAVTRFVDAPTSTVDPHTPSPSFNA